jgi:hypothetical protein
MVSVWYRFSVVMVRSSSIVRYAYTLLALSMLFLIWYLFWFRPTVETIEYYREQIPILRVQQEHYSKLALKYKKYEALQKKIKSLALYEVHQVLGWVIECAARNNLLLKSCVPKKHQNQYGYSYAPFEFSLHGSFQALREFFAALAASPYAFECDHCTITAQPHNSGLLCTFLIRLFIGK